MVNSLRKVDFSHPTCHYTWKKNFAPPPLRKSWVRPWYLLTWLLSDSSAPLSDRHVHGGPGGERHRVRPVPGAPLPHHGPVLDGRLDGDDDPLDPLSGRPVQLENLRVAAGLHHHRGLPRDDAQLTLLGQVQRQVRAQNGTSREAQATGEHDGPHRTLLHLQSNDSDRALVLWLVVWDLCEISAHNQT